MSTTSFQKSVAWQKGYKLVLDVYKSTSVFPIKEQYGLTSQMRRSAASIVFNIAEGLLRHSRREFKQFLVIARGSCGELETQLMLSHDLGYMDLSTKEVLIGKTTEIIKILNTSIKTLNQ